MTVARDDRVGLVVVDADRRIVDVDDAYAEIVGRDRGDLIGKYALSFTHHDDRSRNQPLLDELARSGRGFAITKRYVRGDGSLVWVHNHVSRIRRPVGGHVISATCRPVSAGLTRNHALVRRFCRAVEAMKRDLTTDIVSSPAAEMLVWLYRAELEGRAMRVDQIADVIGSTPSVMIRWARLLEQRGLIETEEGERLATSATVRISAQGERALDGLFSAFGS